MRHHRRIATITLFANLLIFVSSLYADNSAVLKQRWERWQQQSAEIPRTDEFLTTIESPNLFPKSYSPAAADIKVNNDDGTATFRQQYSDIAYFPDGKGVAVWEDERNGEWEIYAQGLTSSGIPSGSNIRLIHSATYFSQRQPRLAVNAAGKMAIVWSEGESGSIYAMIFNSSLTALTNRVKLNDNLTTNSVNLPVVAALANSRFAAVWEDARSGANIFGQTFDDAGNLIGSNFQVNNSVTSPYRRSPDIGASGDTTFAVVWEDARDANQHVYFRILKNDGTPIYSDMMLESNFPADIQFNSQVRFIPGKGYLAGWISTRYAGQSAYAQVISASSVPMDTSFRVNSSLADICWDLRFATTPDSGVGCIFANYDSTATIVLQKVNKLGKLSGTNVTLQDAGVLEERNFPALAFRLTGVNAIWTDYRNGNADIFLQRLDPTFLRVAPNLLLNDDQSGSQQYSPDLSWLPQGANAIVWQDCKNDAGDIYLQRISLAGSPIGLATRLNDDAGNSLQAAPRIGTSTNGAMVAVWEDNRTATGIAGRNIFAQRVASNGSMTGANLIVNSDGTSAPKSQPDIAVGNDGSFKIAWADERSGKKQIYIQRYNTSGIPDGANQLVADVPSASGSFAPHVGTRSDGSFVVTFLSIIGSNQTLYFQRFNSTGLPVGDMHMLDIDTTQVKVLDGDIFVHDFKGSFYIAAILSTSTGDVIKWYRYGFNGNLELANIQVSDVTGANFADVRTNGDIDDGIVVSWSDQRSGIRRGYFQVMREDGNHIGINTPMSSFASPVLEQQPVAVLNNGFVFGTWIDNRNLGRGFDVFLNHSQYTSTDVGGTEATLPKQFDLEQNYPNPFNPETVIRYSLRASEPVKLTVLNTLGQQVRTLVDDYQVAGTHTVTWDGRSSEGTSVASGIYFYRLQAGDYSETRKMTLLK